MAKHIMFKSNSEAIWLINWIMCSFGIPRKCTKIYFCCLTVLFFAKSCHSSVSRSITGSDNIGTSSPVNSEIIFWPDFSLTDNLENFDIDFLKCFLLNFLIVSVPKLGHSAIFFLSGANSKNIKGWTRYPPPQIWSLPAMK